MKLYHRHHDPLRAGPPLIRPGRFLWGWRLGLIGLLVGIIRLCVADPVPKEYQLKAAFLYNFTKFVEWPAGHFPGKTNPIVIGVLGENPFGGELGKVVADRNVSGRPLTITNICTAVEATRVDLLFVAHDQESLLAGQLVTLHAAGVITVGESPAFAAADGIITFTTDNGRIRFEINNDVAEQAGIRISANLLKLATAVKLGSVKK